MIQNAVGEVTELAHVKQLADLGGANGNKALTYDTYVDLLLEACSTFDKQRALPGRQKRAVYSSVLSDNDLDYPYDHADDSQYKVYNVDTDISEIMAYAANSNGISNRSGSNSQASNRVPYADWIKMTQEQCDQLIAKRNQERLAKAGGNSKSFAPRQLANIHDVDTFVDLDHIIDYATMRLEMVVLDSNNNVSMRMVDQSSWLAYMAGQKSSCGDGRAEVIMW
jgi:hypothetical protein